MNPLVSVSIPIFKCETSIEQCLRSVLNQTYKNIEILLVNDQTPDNSAKIAEDFLKNSTFRNWEMIDLEENKGLSVVRNKGIDAAKGKYMFFLDSDDEITPDCIENMVKLAEKTDVQMVVGEVEAINLETGKKTDVFPIKTEESIVRGNQKILQMFVKGQYPVSSWNKLIRLDFLRNNLLYFTQGLFAQDALQSFQTALKLESIAFLRQKTYVYYLHQNSVIHNRNERHFNNWITIAKIINEEYEKEKNPKRKHLILQYLIDFKTVTLEMNWKAKMNEALWKHSYTEYSKLKSLEMKDYLSKDFTKKLKKQALFSSLPTNLGFKVFKWRYER